MARTKQTARKALPKKTKLLSKGGSTERAVNCIRDLINDILNSSSFDTEYSTDLQILLKNQDIALQWIIEAYDINQDIDDLSNTLLILCKLRRGDRPLVEQMQSLNLSPMNSKSQNFSPESNNSFSFVSSNNSPFQQQQPSSMLNSQNNHFQPVSKQSPSAQLFTFDQQTNNNQGLFFSNGSNLTNNNNSGFSFENQTIYNNNNNNNNNNGSSQQNLFSFGFGNSNTNYNTEENQQSFGSQTFPSPSISIQSSSSPFSFNKSSKNNDENSSINLFEGYENQGGASPFFSQNTSGFNFQKMQLPINQFQNHSNSHLGFKCEPLLNLADKLHTPEMIIMFGLPGSGKSAFVKENLEPHGYVRINRDTLGSQQMCHSHVEANLKQGISVVIDNTNLTVDGREPYIELANQYGCRVRCLHMTTSKEQCREWNEKRSQAGLQEFVPEVAYRRFQRIMDHPTLDEGLHEIISVTPVV